MTDSLRQAMTRLADVLERENAALRVMDLAQAALLLPDKTEAMAALTAFGEPPVVAAPELTAAARRLAEVTQDNRTLLRRGLTAQQRVIEIVANAAAAAAPKSCYRATGRMARMSGPMTLSTQA